MKQKKVPLRKCLITREQYPKKELIRIVLNKEEGLKVDVSGKMNGRGAYLKLSAANIDLAQKNRVFEREFKLENIDSVYDELRGLINE